MRRLVNRTQLFILKAGMSIMLWPHAPKHLAFFSSNVKCCRPFVWLPGAVLGRGMWMAEGVEGPFHLKLGGSR